MNITLCLAQGMDTLPVVMELFNQQELWGMFSNKNHIPLRGRTDTKSIENFPAFDMLPHVRPLIFGIMARVEGEMLVKVDIHRIEPGQTLVFSPEHPERYIVPLQSSGGVVLEDLVGEVQLDAGSCWQALSQYATEIKNNSGFPAVMLVAKIVPHGPATYSPEPKDDNLSTGNVEDV